MTVEIININKTIDGDQTLKDISFYLEDTDFLAILGKSGSGKSTLLRIIAGLSKQDSGQVFIKDEDCSHKIASQRNISMIFQDYALYPHMTVENNILFPHPKQKLDLVKDLSSKLGVKKYLKEYPAQLSGGEQQRVAIARSLISEKNLFLLDEPFANLDSKNKSIMRQEVISLHKELNKPFIIVTHDITDALTLSNKMILIVDGKIIQAGNTKEIYEKPSSLEALSLTTKEEVNVLDAYKIDDKILFAEIDQRIKLDSIVNDFSDNKRELCLGFKPEDVEIYDGNNNGLVIKTKVITYDYYGAEVLIKFDYGISMLTNSNIRLKADSDINIFIPYDKIFLYPR